MCGRYSLIADLGELVRRFESTYNVAPTQAVLTVVSGEIRRGGYMRWSLIPRWAKKASIGSRMINARAETVAEGPRSALRCGDSVGWCSQTASMSGRRSGPAGDPCVYSYGQRSRSHSPDSGRHGGTRRA